MADCSKLMKEALEGITFSYKLDDVLNELNPKQKFSRDQLEGYLKKQGVSPKEIQQSGIFDNAHSRPINAEAWVKINPGKHRITESQVESMDYADVTLNPAQAEIDDGAYREQLAFINKPTNNAPVESHFAKETEALNKSISGEDPRIVKLREELETIDGSLEFGENGFPVMSKREEEIYKEIREIKSEKANATKSLLGWRRLHDETINGKRTTVLNEFQSDWAQSERAGRGTFESSLGKQIDWTKDDYVKVDSSAYFNVLDDPDLNKRYPNLYEAHYYDGNGISTVNFKMLKDIAGKDTDAIMNLIKGDGSDINMIADFPMSEKKFHQYQIVAALDEAIKTGTNRIAIPIERSGSLQGSPGVTKFYDSLNKKVLPEIRKKLEKQGMKLKLGKEDYQQFNSNLQEFMNDFDWSIKQGPMESRERLGYLLDLWDYLNFNTFPDYPFKESFDEVIYNATDKQVDEIAKTMSAWIHKHGMGKNNPLHVLEIEEIPNKKVKWDIYGVLGAIGLGSVADKLKEKEQL